jgi:hypothetical protein
MVVGGAFSMPLPFVRLSSLNPKLQRLSCIITVIGDSMVTTRYLQYPTRTLLYLFRPLAAFHP